MIRPSATAAVLSSAAVVEGHKLDRREPHEEMPGPGETPAMTKQPSLTERGLTMAKEGARKYLATSRRNKVDHLYSTYEDFTRADPGRKRLVVIGCTGSGKSTLLNVLSGWRFVQSKETDYEFKWQTKGEGEGAAHPIFESAISNDSVTKKTVFANVHFRGDSERELIVVDTPGHDDPVGCELDSKEAREALGEMAADLHNKLKALGSVHALLVLHNDVLSNRLNPATYQILKVGLCMRWTITVLYAP